MIFYFMEEVSKRRKPVDEPEMLTGDWAPPEQVKKVLHLTLKRRWFDEILSGVKKVEYRIAKPYWTRRLEGKHFDGARFRNGYRRDAPFMRVEVVNISKEAGWYHIRLGDILECILMEGDSESFGAQTWGERRVYEGPA